MVALAYMSRIAILAFVFYFTAIEVIQCYRDTFMKHIADFWNYLDIIPPILIVTTEILNFSTSNVSNNDSYDSTIRTLYAFTALAMWLRFLYFFRIVRSTGYYIRMIIMVIVDMG